MSNFDYIYLHGFASGARSNKAQYLANLFREYDLNLSVLDLNQNDFSHLTITRKINHVADYFGSKPVILIGSSLGGLTAAILAEKYPDQVKKLVLLAPAFNFLDHFLPKLGKNTLKQWKNEGYLDIYHYESKKPIPLHYHFILDAYKYKNFELKQAIPTLIFHGINDDVIPVHSSRNYAKNRPWVNLIELNTDHGLTDKLTEIGGDIMNFV